MESLLLNFRPGIKEKLRAKAETLGVSMTTLINHILNEILKNESEDRKNG